ncbi:hypothetical protein ACFQVD_42720 [Streptosporangium amethystogenes subsp. fukuiense]|uniref:Uncharacterized protein n=1 Tax=Streptosporangium amethystogenes subsp. fukuiense TaxID=698418 RepID=A0ABW2TFR4_9ACTN
MIPRYGEIDITEHRRLEGGTSGSGHFLLAASGRDGEEEFPRPEGRGSGPYSAGTFLKAVDTPSALPARDRPVSVRCLDPR